MATQFGGRNGTDSTFCAAVEGGGFAEFERDGTEWVFVGGERLTDEQLREVQALTDEQRNALHEEAVRESVVIRYANAARQARDEAALFNR